MPQLQLTQISASPRLFQVDDFLNAEEIAYVLKVAQDKSQLAMRGISARPDISKDSFELPVFGDAVLEEVRARVSALCQLQNDLGATLRFRCSRAGESSPSHCEVYELADRSPIITAVIYLRSPELGGEIHFPHAQPSPIHVMPRPGRLVLWFNYRPDGTADPAAEHASLPVTSGEQITITSSLYKRLAHADTQLEPRALSQCLPKETGIQFHCIDDGVPESTIRALRSACKRRGVEYLAVRARGFDYSAARPLTSRALLYRPAVSIAAMRVEQFLYTPTVSSFYEDARIVYYDCLTPPLLLERAGVPIPKTIYASTTERSLLRRYVEHLGGLPLVVKWLGRSGGNGVLRVDSLAALFSLMDHAKASGSQPLLCQYIADATHFRLVVVGDRVAASYRNPQAKDDFRTYASEEAADYLATPPKEMLDLAVRATRAQGVSTAGVDILAAPDGQLYVLEANFPCYFAQAQLAVGVDVSGMMLEYLLEKRRNLHSP